MEIFPEDDWKNPKLKWEDPTCGNGNFLVEIKTKLLEYHSKDYILENMIYGADIMRDNIKECIGRLYGPGEIKTITVDSKDFPKTYYKPSGLIAIFRHKGKIVKNIVQADGLVYDYSFGEFPEDTIEEKNGLTIVEPGIKEIKKEEIIETTIITEGFEGDLSKDAKKKKVKKTKIKTPPNELNEELFS